MKISNREKILLLILGSLIVIAGYYNYIYIYQKNVIKDKTQEERKLEEKYTDSLDTIEKMDIRKKQLKILRGKVDNGSSIFYPIISEEHIVWEIDKMLNDSGLDGGLTFENKKCTFVEDEKKEQFNNNESTFQSIVDSYKHENHNKSLDKKANSDSKHSDEKNTIECLKGSISFNGTYDGLNKFLSTITGNERKIIVNSILVDTGSLSSVSGTMNIEIYSLPKVDDQLKEYLNWPFENVAGKVNPFDKTSLIVNTKAENEERIILSVMSQQSELPTIMIGKENDVEKSSYVYADNKGIENAKMNFTFQNGKYYFKYKTSNESYPKKYSNLGEEFKTVGDNINVKIISENRVDDDDESGVNLKVVNETDKLVKIDIENDDKDKPRVSIDGDSSKISISNS